MFKLSDRLSCVLLVSGNGRFDGKNIKEFVDEFCYKVDIDKIDTVDEIKNSLNESISNSSHSLTSDEYVRDKFPEFENIIRNMIAEIGDKSKSIHYLKLNSENLSIDFLNNSKLLDNLLSRLTNSLFQINDKNEFVEVKIYLKSNFYEFLLNKSSSFALVGYDESNDNPTYINYNILGNIDGKLEIIEKYSLYGCKSTMILTLAQDDDVELNLMGFNEFSYKEIQKIVFELFQEFGNSIEFNDNTFKSINEKLKIKIGEHKLDNLKTIVDYIEFSPDFEILQLLDILVKLTEIKLKFSDKPHSVGGKRIKAVLRKYNHVEFVEW